jgi:phosphoenolpyruvate synthase/pyruvate phosphate dikinase
MGKELEHIIICKEIQDPDIFFPLRIYIFDVPESKKDEIKKELAKLMFNNIEEIDTNVRTGINQKEACIIATYVGLNITSDIKFFSLKVRKINNKIINYLKEIKS